MGIVKHFEIYLVILDPTKGSEIKKQDHVNSMCTNDQLYIREIF